MTRLMRSALSAVLGASMSHNIGTSATPVIWCATRACVQSARESDMLVIMQSIARIATSSVIAVITREFQSASLCPRDADLQIAEIGYRTHETTYLISLAQDDDIARVVWTHVPEYSIFLTTTRMSPIWPPRISQISHRSFHHLLLQYQSRTTAPVLYMSLASLHMPHSISKTTGYLMWISQATQWTRRTKKRMSTRKRKSPKSRRGLAQLVRNTA